MKYINNKFNILILPCSTQIAVEQYNSLKYNKHFNLIGASHNNSDVNYKNFIQLINIKEDSKFITEIENIVQTHNIDAILTAHDEIQFILKNSKLADKIVGSDTKTVNICRFKSKTYELLNSNNFLKNHVPLFELVIDNKINKNFGFIKPDNGQGSRGAFKYSNEQFIEDNHINCEFLCGDEFTIDCFTDKNKDLIFTQARKRLNITNGISEKTELFFDEIFEPLAQEINKIFNFNGAWFFQMKKDTNENFKFLEISPRIAGASNIHRMNGINLTALSLYQYFNYDIKIVKQNLVSLIERKNPKIKLKFNTIYVDYDDTFYFVKKDIEKLNKKIVVITRSKNKVKLPYEIIYVKDNENKSNYIQKESIFIDDSNRERTDVLLNCNIPCFGLEEVEYIEAI
jgi:hypothetical protein